ncbi:MAG: hypothetical protein M3304_02295 [Actinomycetota bacterium]|nr:hypothetical protein [Actinomycetota bacterium]
MRVEEVFAAAGLNIRGEMIPPARIRITCPNCTRVTGADLVRHLESGQQTNHDCPHCAATMLTVSPAHRPGGYRLKDWTVIALAGMTIDVPLVDEQG